MEHFEAFVGCYCPTRRQKCSSCAEQIEKGSIMIKLSGPLHASKYFHCDCCFQLYGFYLPNLDLDSISREDKQKILNLLTSKISPENKIDLNMDELDNQINLKSHKRKIKSTKEDHLQNLISRKPPKIPKISNKSSNELATFKNQVDLLSVQSLKDLLRLNRQKLGGTKSELVLRVSASMAYGVLPRCPECGGFLRENSVVVGSNGTRGKFTCPGRFDDAIFIPCRFKTDQVTRIPWISS